MINVYTTPANLDLEPVTRDGRDKFVVVFLSHIVTEQLQNYRCNNCGWIVFQHSSKNVAAIVYGAAAPKDKTTLDVQCQRCHTMFRVI